MLADKECRFYVSNNYQVNDLSPLKPIHIIVVFEKPEYVWAACYMSSFGRISGYWDA